MTVPTFSHIAIHDAPGELRAALLDQIGQPWRLFTLRWSGDGALARPGTIQPARLTKFAETQGGAFLVLETGEEAFLRLKSRDGLTEGQTLQVKIISSARREKLARATQTNEAPQTDEAFEAWRAQVPGGQNLDIKEDLGAVEAAFEEAVLPRATLQGGGQLHIERTRALTAFDVDTSGRAGKGSAGARALSVNLSAAREMVRQILLRDLGGAMVLDCVAPLNQSAGQRLRDEVQKQFQAADARKIQALAPSRFGLLEASVPWLATPLQDLYAMTPGETSLLTALRMVEREAIHNPTALFILDLEAQPHAIYVKRKRVVETILKDRFGGRIVINPEAAIENRVQKR